MKKRFRFSNQRIDVTWNETAAAEPVQVMIYESIGKDPWDGTGMSATDFKKVLDSLPLDRDVHFHVNSRGGDVHEGLTMRSQIEDLSQKTVAIIDGIAASTASWMILACDEVKARKNCQMFIHDAIAFGFGNSEDLRKTADQLDKTSDQIAGMYAEKTGKGVRTMRQLMKDETLLTGEEAEEMGLVDELIEEKAVRNFSATELESMKNRLAAFRNSVAKSGGLNKEQTMNKKTIIAILNKHGVTTINGVAISEQTPDEHLEAALNQVLDSKKEEKKSASGTDLDAVKAELKELKEANQTMAQSLNEARRIRITSTVDELIRNDQLPAGLKEKALARALGDETYLDELKAYPSRPPGSEPLAAIQDDSKILESNASFKDVQNFMLENGPRFREKFIRNNAGRGVDKRVCLEIRDRAVLVANAWQKHRNMLVQMFNTNNIDAGLQRQIILQEMLEEFAIVLLPLQNFSAVFNNVPLEGTDEVDVPFYPLQAAGQAQSWNPATGYATFADTTTNTRPVVVGGSGTSSGSSAAANTAKDRKFIGMKFSSYELARQPYLNVSKLGIQNANRLAVDIFSDIVSRVVTRANFGTPAKIQPAAAFASADVADLYGTATGANWPARGRALVLDHTYNVSLIKDNAFKQYLAYGSTDPIRKALIQQAYGFEDINVVPNLTSYTPTGESLAGWINWMYAVLVATSPIMPTEEVRALLTRYDVVVHPALGVAFEYRRFGDTTLDQTKEVVECSYGANKGVASALKLLASAA